ncbi:MAG TPA: type I 3-dehydroquinate dehydratase [Chthoniobacterales bacterium]
MRAQAPVNQEQGRSRTVGVIASPAALERAPRLRRLPDFFELRLDLLHHSLGMIELALPRLRAPVILTARHPAEGGAGRLPLQTRRDLILRFLAGAALVDLEFRSVRRMPALREEMQRRGVGLILSRHDLRDTPSLGTLRRFAQAAAGYQPAILKVATRTDTPAQLARLLAFFEETRLAFPVAAMGIGTLGLASRRRLALLGSALTYASLDRTVVLGQPTLADLCRARRAYSK